MKLDIKIIGSLLLGAMLVFILMTNNNSNTNLIPIANASKMKTNQFETDYLKFCQVFFSDDRDNFEQDINNRLKNAKLFQSNVLWSETTKNFGFYALICY